MSIKRIIELEEVIVNNEIMYRAKGCNTLFFDKNGFDKITKPYEDPNKLLNCNFIVLDTSDESNLTKGKVYEVVDGKFANDLCTCFPLDIELDTFENLERYLSSYGLIRNGEKYIYIWWTDKYNESSRII